MENLGSGLVAVIFRVGHQNPQTAAGKQILEAQTAAFADSLQAHGNLHLSNQR